MSLAEELARLAELRERGHLSPAEHAAAKQRALEAARQPEHPSPEAAQGPDGADPLYRLVVSWLRRAAAAMALMALLSGLVSAWSGLRFLDLNAAAAAIQDAAIAEGFGVRIPDPRPAIERAVLESQAAAFAGLAIVTGLIAVGGLVGAVLVRPPRQPPKGSGSRGGRSPVKGHELRPPR